MKAKTSLSRHRHRMLRENGYRKYSREWAAFDFTSFDTERLIRTLFRVVCDFATLKMPHVNGMDHFSFSSATLFLLIGRHPLVIRYTSSHLHMDRVFDGSRLCLNYAFHAAEWGRHEEWIDVRRIWFGTERTDFVLRLDEAFFVVGRCAYRNKGINTEKQRDGASLCFDDVSSPYFSNPIFSVLRC